MAGGGPILPPDGGDKSKQSGSSSGSWWENQVMPFGSPQNLMGHPEPGHLTTPKLFDGILSGLADGTTQGNAAVASAKAQALLTSTGDFSPEQSAAKGQGSPPSTELTVLNLDKYKSYTVITGTTKTYQSKGYVGSTEQDKNFQKNGSYGDRFTLVPERMDVPGAVLAFRKLALDDSSEYQHTVAQLVRAGYLNPKDATFSAYTNVVGKAYLDALLDISSNQSDQGAHSDPSKILTADQWLAQLAEEKDRDHDGLPDFLKSTKQAPQVQNVWTDPKAVIASVQSTAESIIGRKLSKDEAAKFAGIFHGAEAKFNEQRNAFDAPAVDLTNPDLAANAQSFVEDNFKGEAHMQADATYIKALEQMLSSGG